MPDESTDRRSDDTRWMRDALMLARAGLGRTSPNPAVGAIVRKNGMVLGMGVTEPCGGRHAEVVALDQATARFGADAVRGATLVVTLEPCSHVGRQPACAPLVVGSGVERVVIGLTDPNPMVSGAGVQHLRSHGITVVDGILRDACAEHHRGYLSLLQRGRPFVTLKLATTLDSRIATSGGESKWITGVRSRAFVHQLRNEVDAVLVGSSTVLADEPSLDARIDDREVYKPQRIVLDTNLRALAWAEPERERTWLMCSDQLPHAMLEQARVRGFRVYPTATCGAGLDLEQVMMQLGAGGIAMVLVEGGAAVATSLLRARLVDEVHWFIAPRLFGSDGLSALGPLGVRTLAQGIELDVCEAGVVGTDLHICGKPRYCER